MSIMTQVVDLNSLRAEKQIEAENTAEIKKLNDLAHIDTSPLFTFRSVFPFDLFPNRVTIDRSKITVVDNLFFFTRQVQSLMIKDLMSVITHETLLLSSLHIIDRQYPQETIIVANLQKSDARKARRIIEGLIVADKEGVDLSRITNEQLIPKLEEIGRSHK